MGCWNGTCMVSHLPIISGEKIKLVILNSRYGFIKESNPILGNSGYCYSNDLLSPGFFAISGVYNDYGGIEDIEEDWNYKVIEEFFQTKYSKVKCEGNILENPTLPQILEAIEREEFEIFTEGDKRMKEMAVKAMEAYKDTPKAQEHWKDIAEMDVSEKWEKSTYSAVMIRQDIWDSIVNREGGEDYWNDEKDEVDENGERVYYISAQEWTKRTFKKEIDKIDKLIEEYGIDDELMLMELKYNKIFNDSYAGSGKLSAVSPYSKLLIEKDLRDNIEKQWSENTAISSFIGSTRRGWMIQPGKGSQHDGWKEHMHVAQTILDICKNKIKEYEE